MKRRVAWVSDFNLHSGRGGAEMNDKAVYEEGIRRGHNLFLLMPESAPQDPRALAEYDLVVVSNAQRFTVPYTVALGDAGIPYVMALKDFWPLCSWRLNFPRMDICKRCPNLGHTGQMLSRSLCNVFSSPLHQDAWAWSVPQVTQWPSFLHPSPVDGDVFRSGLAPREPGTALGVQCLLSFKGGASVVKYVREHPELRFTFAGGAEPPFVQGLDGLPNVRLVGDVSLEDLARLYAASEYYLHLPDTPQPFERTCAEARLAGCKLIINHLVGAASWPEFTKLTRDQYAAWLQAAPARWWEHMEVMV